MTAILLPNGKQHYDNAAGAPLSGGFVYTYDAGTSNPRLTWLDAAQTAPNANPIVLDARGEASIFWSGAYKVVITDSTGASVWTQDGLTSSPAALGSFVPGTLNAFDLGSTTYYWRSLYIGTSIVPVLNSATLGNQSSGFANAYFGSPALPAVSTPGVGYASQTAAEVAAGVTPIAYFYPERDARRYGANFNLTTDDTASVNYTIAVAGQQQNGSQGSCIYLPQGTSLLTSMVTLPNRVRLIGVNKRGSYFQAKSSGWSVGTSPYMTYAVGGTWSSGTYTPSTTSSMFDSTLENLTLDANNIAGLGCVQTQAWQEDCGLRGAMLINFTTYGIRYLTSTGGLGGGQSLSRISDTEIFGGASGSTAGIQVDSISAVGGFMLAVTDTTITGSVGGVMAKGIAVVSDSLHCRNVHFEQCTSGIYLDGPGNHVLIGVTGGPNVTNLVEIASTFTGTVRMLGCFRNTATNFLKDNRSGGYGTITGYDFPDFTIGSASQGLRSPSTAQAWCTFNGTTTGTNAPTAGFNVTSVTRNSAGNYTVTFTRQLPNANSVPVASCNSVASGTSVGTQAASAASVNVLVSVSGTPTDASEVKCVVFGL